MDLADRSREWLEADGLGGFASGTVPGIRTRRYHALLLAATTPPVGRYVLVNGFDAELARDDVRVPVTSHLYESGVVAPDAVSRIRRFEAEPWPRWTLDVGGGLTLEQEVIAAHGSPVVVVRFRLHGTDPARFRLLIRPFLSGRDPHCLHHENGAFRFAPEPRGRALLFRPYAGLPAVASLATGAYRHDPHWYRGFLYEEERARGLDCVEDLAAPGILDLDLVDGEAVWILGAEIAGAPPFAYDSDPVTLAGDIRERERDRRLAFGRPLHRAADAYIVRRGRHGRTVVAGYPWFTDWGRDTFIALRGLAIATGRLDDARDILLEWSGHVSRGMLPNRFAEYGSEPEYNSVDASLWFVVAVHELGRALERRGHALPPADAERLRSAAESILAGYAEGTRFGIRMDADGLLASGAPGMQLSWMDAKIGDRVVTPRHGKPVEVQALWLNALRIGCAWSSHWMNPLERGTAAFGERFWNPERACLFDVVDVEGRRDEADSRLRPNQLLAVGGLPFPVLDDARRARSVVDVCERLLLTPLGPRTLAPGEPGYAGECQGDVAARDGAYHQGTVWPWLMGPFVEAWVRVRGSSPQAKAEARARFLVPFLEHVSSRAGIGHVSEIADGDPPHAPRGCPFQAWSLGELLRLEESVLGSF